MQQQMINTYTDLMTALDELPDSISLAQEQITVPETVCGGTRAQAGAARGHPHPASRRQTQSCARRRWNSSKRATSTATSALSARQPGGTGAGAGRPRQADAQYGGLLSGAAARRLLSYLGSAGAGAPRGAVHGAQASQRQQPASSTSPRRMRRSWGFSFISVLFGR